MRDDYDWNDDEGEGDSEENLRRWEAADAKFRKFERTIEAKQNLTRAKQTEVTLLELYIHEMVENEIRSSTFMAAAADLETQEILQRISRR